MYRICDREGALLYVGMGRNPAARWASHSEQHEWWQRAARFRVEWFATRKEAAAAELEAIRSEDPECNIYGRPGWGSTCTRSTCRSSGWTGSLRQARREIDM
ncbi:GIY-YIG nuclease family protein [Streptomyces rectiviolaceus]|uniref:GIY-YIG nuclease family protein n=1 Tax=Streptomyces rectiviolaceus TaxID=332591 RepID=UPI003626C88A